MPRTAILLVAYGAPDSLDAIEPFMRNLMGRDPSPELLERTRMRYLTIGGASPLPRKAELVAAALERSLSGLPPAEKRDDEAEETLGGFLDDQPTRAHHGVTVPVAVGMLHWNPSIRDAVYALADAGADRIVWVSLSPFESVRTTKAFRQAVAEACEEAEVTGVEVRGYHASLEYEGVVAILCRDAIDELPQGRNAAVFTAHSLPVAELGDGAYRQELEGLTERVGQLIALGAPDPDGTEALFGIRAFGGPGGSTPWLLAYQSQGALEGEWLGPSLDEAIDAVFAAGFDSVALCPIGFVLDHLETLYDLDVDAADRVLLAEKEYSRASVPNDDPRFIEVLANAIKPHL